MTTPQNQWFPQVDGSVDPKVTVHIQRIYPALNNHDRAIRALNDKVKAIQTSVTTVTKTVNSTTSSSSSGGGTSTTSFPGLGYINPQLGLTTYLLVQSDSGIELQVGDASPVAISLDTTLNSPFIVFITNLGPSLATLTPTAGATINGAATFDIPKNSMSVVVLSNLLWYASAIQIVPLDTPVVLHEWLDSYDDATGVFTQSQPDFADISGTVDPSQLPTPTVGTLGGVEAAGPTVHQWIDQIDLSGVPHLSQPTADDVIPAFSTTAGRPVSPATGYMDFDTDLGKPIWWDGAQWVDATGTPA
jgi:hypothetical protein